MTGRGEGYCVLEMIPGRGGPISVRGPAGLAAGRVRNGLSALPEANGLAQWGIGPTRGAAGQYYAGYPATGSVPFIRPQAVPYGAATPFLPYRFGAFYGPGYGRGFVPAYPGRPGFGGGMRRGTRGRGHRGWFGRYR